MGAPLVHSGCGRLAGIPVEKHCKWLSALHRLRGEQPVAMGVQERTVVPLRQRARDTYLPADATASSQRCFPQRLWMSHGRACGKGTQVFDDADLRYALPNNSSSSLTRHAAARFRQHAAGPSRVFHSGCGCGAGMLVEKQSKCLMPLVHAGVAKHLVTRPASCDRRDRPCTGRRVVFSTGAVDVPSASLWKRHPSG